jgi:hypothetical protein
MPEDGLRDQATDLSRREAPQDKGGAYKPLFYRVVKKDPGKKSVHNIPLYTQS